MNHKNFIQQNYNEERLDQLSTPIQKNPLYMDITENLDNQPTKTNDYQSKYQSKNQNIYKNQEIIPGRTNSFVDKLIVKGVHNILDKHLQNKSQKQNKNFAQISPILTSSLSPQKKKNQKLTFQQQESKDSEYYDNIEVPSSFTLTNSSLSQQSQKNQQQQQQNLPIYNYSNYSYKQDIPPSPQISATYRNYAKEKPSSQKYDNKQYTQQQTSKIEQNQNSNYTNKNYQNNNNKKNDTIENKINNNINKINQSINNMSYLNNNKNKNTNQFIDNSNSQITNTNTSPLKQQREKESKLQNSQYMDYVKIKERKRSSFLDRIIFQGVNNILDKHFNSPKQKNSPHLKNLQKSQKSSKNQSPSKYNTPLKNKRLEIEKNNYGNNNNIYQQIDSPCLEKKKRKVKGIQKTKKTFAEQITAKLQYNMNYQPDNTDRLEIQFSKSLQCSPNKKSRKESPIKLKVTNTYSKKNSLTLIEENWVKPIFEDDYDISLSQKPTRLFKNHEDNIVNPFNLDDLDKIEIQSPLQPNQVKRDLFLKQLNQEKQRNTKFTDLEFPPNMSALTNRPTIEIKKKFSRYQQFNNWERIENIFNNKNVYLTKYIDPSDIQIGKLRSHNVLSVLSALAEDPTRIQKLLEDQTVNSSGIYYVRICKDGIWKYITVDDYFPCNKQKNELIFSSNTTDENQKSMQEIEFWAPLIEKALVKCYGTYQDQEITDVSIKEILRELTGFPTETLKLDQNINNLGSLIKETLEKGYMIMASNEDSLEKQELCANYGIPPNYSFSIIESTRTTINLRNPWGWVEQSEYEVSKSIERGTFKLSIGQLIKFFDKLIIVQIIKDNYYIAKQTRHTANAYTILEFEKKVPGRCTIEATQLDKRLFRTHITKKLTKEQQTQISRNLSRQNSRNTSPQKNKQIQVKNLIQNEENYDYSMGRIIICKKNDTDQINPYSDHSKWERDWNFLVAESGKEKTLSMEIDLEVGRYCILLLMDWKNPKQYFDINVSYYGREKIYFSRVDYKLASNLISNAFISESVVHGYLYKNKNQIQEYIYISENERIVVFTFQNRSQQEVTFVKDLSKINKKYLELITPINQYDDNGFQKMNTREIQESKTQYTQAYINLQSGQFKALTFKLVDPEIQFNPKTLYQLGLR